jgi:hypothetical protein
LAQIVEVIGTEIKIDIDIDIGIDIETVADTKTDTEFKKKSSKVSGEQLLNRNKISYYGYFWLVTGWCRSGYVYVL